MAKQRSFFDKIVQKVRRDAGYAWTLECLDSLKRFARSSRRESETSALTNDHMMPNLQQEAYLRVEEEEYYLSRDKEPPDPPLFPGLMLAWEDRPVTLEIDDELVESARLANANFAATRLDDVRALFPACLLIDVCNRRVEMYGISVDALFVYPSYDADCGYELLLIVGVSLRHGLLEPLCGKYVMAREFLGEAMDYTVSERERLRKRCMSRTDYGLHEEIFSPYEDEEKIVLLAMETLGLLLWEGTVVDTGVRRGRAHLRARCRGEGDGPFKLRATRAPEVKPAPEPVLTDDSEPEPVVEPTPEDDPVLEEELAPGIALVRDPSFEEELISEVARLEQAVAEQRTKIASLSYHLQQSRKSLEETQRLLSGAQNRAHMLEVLELPASSLEALELAGKVFADKIIVLEQARKSAREYMRGSVPEVWSVLRSIAMVLHPLIFGQGGHNVVYAFEEQTGYELTLREMKQIKRVESFSRLRSIDYKGEKRSIAAHVKGRGRARGETLRVHFLVDYDEQKIVIAHCGEHLATYDTSSL